MQFRSSTKESQVLCSQHPVLLKVDPDKSLWRANLASRPFRICQHRGCSALEYIYIYPGDPSLQIIPTLGPTSINITLSYLDSKGYIYIYIHGLRMSGLMDRIICCITLLLRIGHIHNIRATV